MKAPRALADWTDAELLTLIKRYEQRGLTSGGPYTLADLRLELARRVKSPHDPRELAERILTLAAASPDQRVTFGALFENFYGRRPQGHGDIKKITSGLERLGAYCHDAGLPILSTLVVNKATRDLTETAIYNVWSYLRQIDPATPEDPAAFVREQAALAEQLAIERHRILPAPPMAA